ncbi:hypothetical protein RFI_33699 [Reticulomyxa filosa]|uniref:Uncharacterized protein n=1 Tax=Reticulomyxa filosa TaxID=46433 RepID=X6LP42_RETFI|nr:hypothetical protein RFI_33699 [Reticulomyxa filosa]|eukprot:ETO03703.1 hypothetical protein RFI_33699 [Reticulomyxa filosa]
MYICVVLDEYKTSESAQHQLERFIFYVSRYENHLHSSKIAKSKLEEFKDHDYLVDAVNTIIDCHELLAWTYPLQFYLFEDDKHKLLLDDSSHTQRRTGSHKKYGDSDDDITDSKQKQRSNKHKPKNKNKHKQPQKQKSYDDFTLTSTDQPNFDHLLEYLQTKLEKYTDNLHEIMEKHSLSFKQRTNIINSCRVTNTFKEHLLDYIYKNVDFHQFSFEKLPLG